MSSAATRRPGGRRRVRGDAPRRVTRAAGEAPTLFGEAQDAVGEPTLEELVSGVWEGLVAHQMVPCPVCSGAMLPAGPGPATAGESAPGGCCGDCGTTVQ